tara:strand:+ start:782 stop:1177 length:396 start_codon:yes stop_codon:yes gene_type:complete
MMFWVAGQPVGKGRPRFSKFGVYTPAKTKAAEKRIAAIASDAMQEQSLEPLKEACAVHIVAKMQVPVSWTKKKQAAALLGDVPPSKPDIDNIAKLVLDSINGVCYEDDAQIILLSVTKVFAQEAGTLVRVE